MKSDDVDARSPERRPTLFDIGRASFSAGVNVLKKIVPGFPENANADEKQDFLEAVVQQRAEMKYLQEQLEKEREKVGSLKRRAEAAEERVHRREQAFLAQSSSLEEANEDIDRLFKEMGEMRELRGRYETRIQSLVEERGNLNKRLKSMQDNRAAQSKISLDPFKDQVDQVSEAAVKSGVESLNDSIDTFIMTLLDEAESVAARHSSSTLPSAVQNHEETDKLISALSQYSRSEEKRGFLLDANLHHGLVSELDKLFFSGDVLPSVMERRLANALLKDMSKHESWSVVQRWRALTATSGANFLGKVIPGSITTYAKSIVILLAWAYRQPLATFEPLGPTAEKRLQGLYDEAARLSLTVRRDILSVRMSIVAPIKTDDGYPPFDTRSAHTPWPDMGTETGDEVIGLYRFGLRKEAERAAPAFIVRPEVTTAVLLRFVAKE
ncbi:hypothetical protein FB45DRAFT_738189 [Roridomyces roridus]|uniref:Uncharacterized protein n=1 Tax=Roridomyces roridus TaxID=1738132 RepID=A0AAD7C7T9_9AGAR|nr:hypothetical protein FB45DRAFT_738189 [Roridomyces roridus]